MSDPGAAAHDAFKVSNPLAKGMRDKLKSFGYDIDEWSGDEHHKVAIPSMFLVGQDGKILWAHAYANHRSRPKFDAVVAAVSAALKKTPPTEPAPPPK